MKTNNFGLFTFVFVLLASLLAEAQDLNSVQVTEVTYEGRGCPQGSMQHVFTPDARTFSLLYDAFILNVGGDTNQNTDAKSCDVKVRLKVPFGYVVNIESAQFRGFMSLDGGVFAQHEVQTQVGPNKLATLGFGTQVFSGPRQENYLTESQRPGLKLPKFLQCLPLKTDVTMFIRTRIKMTGGEGARLGLMTVDSGDGKIEQRYVLSLKKCL